MKTEDCPHCDDKGLVPGSERVFMSCPRCDAWDEMGTADPSVVAELVRLFDFYPSFNTTVQRDERIPIVDIFLHIYAPDQNVEGWMGRDSFPEDAGVGATLDLLREVYDRFQRPGVAELLGRKP